MYRTVDKRMAPLMTKAQPSVSKKAAQHFRRIIQIGSRDVKLPVLVEPYLTKQ